MNLFYLFPIISGALWGSVGIFVRYLSEHGVDSYTILASRVALAVLILGVTLFVSDRKLLYINKKDVPLFALGGAVGMIGLNFCYNYAVERLTLSLAAVLLSISPVFVVLMAAAFFKEKITVRKSISMALAVGGCILCSGILEAQSVVWSFDGVIIGALGAVFYAFYSIVSKLIMQRGYHGYTITFYCLLFAGIVLMPLSHWSQIQANFVKAPISFGLFMLAHSVFTSVLPYILYTVSLNHIEAGKASILAAGEPVAAMIFGIFVYAEYPTLFSIIGLIMVVTALGILGGSKEKNTN